MNWDVSISMRCNVRICIYEQVLNFDFTFSNIWTHWKWYIYIYIYIYKCIYIYIHICIYIYIVLLISMFMHLHVPNCRFPRKRNFTVQVHRARIQTFCFKLLFGGWSLSQSTAKVLFMVSSLREMFARVLKDGFMVNLLWRWNIGLNVVFETLAL